jgi:hypothetical protein
MPAVPARAGTWALTYRQNGKKKIRACRKFLSVKELERNWGKCGIDFIVAVMD